MLAFQEQWVPQLMTGLTLGDIVSGKLNDWLERMYKDEGSYEATRLRMAFSSLQMFFPLDFIFVLFESSVEQGCEFLVGWGAGEGGQRGGQTAVVL